MKWIRQINHVDIGIYIVTLTTTLFWPKCLKLPNHSGEGGIGTNNAGYYRVEYSFKSQLIYCENNVSIYPSLIDAFASIKKHIVKQCTTLRGKKNGLSWKNKIVADILRTFSGKCVHWFYLFSILMECFKPDWHIKMFAFYSILF